jgi:putative flippase GtrA
LTTYPTKTRQQLVFFTGIGGFAAIVHLTLVFNLVTYLQLPPLVANVFAFLVSFNISFLGHKYMTFSGMPDNKQLQLPHFFFVATSAAVLNEVLYYLLLEYTSLYYLPALVLVLGLAAIYSYCLSRFWACR